MPHVMTMFDSEWVRAWDLGGVDRTVTIEKVEAGSIKGKDGKSAKKPIIWFRGAKKPLAINKTIAKAIIGMYGPDTKDWIGKAITLFPTTTQMAGDTVECIRVRPTVPKQKAQDMPNPEPPPGEREAGQEG